MGDFAKTAAAFDSLERAVRSLEAEGWFASFSDDERVVAIREALAVLGDDEGDAGVREPESPGHASAIRVVTERREAADDWPEPALPPDYWESAK